MDIRDQFAMRFAAALVGALSDPDLIARRSYDLAEAMLAERGRRMPTTEESAIAAEPPPSIEDWALERHSMLLDEPAPYVEDEDEPPYDPTWDLEPPAKSETVAGPSDKERPGLARTQPEPAEIHRERSTG